MPADIVEFDPMDTLLECSGYEMLPEAMQEKVNPFAGDTKTIAKRLVPAIVGAFLIFIGLTTSGSYFLLSTRMFDTMATIFYTYQVGTLMAMVGAILVYDTAKKLGYL